MRRRVADYAKVKSRDFRQKHKKSDAAKLNDSEEIKAREICITRITLFDAQMTHESRLQEIKDRKHDVIHAQISILIDLLRMSEYDALLSSRHRRWENYKYTFNVDTVLIQEMDLYIVIILIFIASVYHYANRKECTVIYSN